MGVLNYLSTYNLSLLLNIVMAEEERTRAEVIEHRRHGRIELQRIVGEELKRIVWIRKQLEELTE